MDHDGTIVNTEADIAFAAAIVVDDEGEDGDLIGLELSLSQASRLTPAAVFCTPTEADADDTHMDAMDGSEPARGREQSLFSFSLTTDRYKYDLLYI